MGLLRKKQDWSIEQFWNHWWEKHGPLAARVPNLRIFETDIDRIAWDSEVFTHEPEYVDGYIVIPDRPGWGTEPNEDAMRKYPANKSSFAGGLITYGVPE